MVPSIAPPYCCSQGFNLRKWCIGNQSGLKNESLNDNITIVYAKVLLKESIAQLILCKTVMWYTQQSLLEWKKVGNEFWLATTNFNLLEKFRLYFQTNGATVCAKCRGYQQLYWRSGGCNMESLTSAPPIHANNQAMQHMAYSQWHC